jgi:hypothetical protein
VAFRYFEGDTYYAPIIKWASPDAAAEPAGASSENVLPGEAATDE